MLVTTKEVKNSDPISERVVIGFLLQHGADVLCDIEDKLEVGDFYNEKNQAIFSCLKDIIDETDATSVTIDAVLSTAKKLNLVTVLSKEDINFLKLCKQQNVSIKELPVFVRQIKFWKVVRELSKQFIVNSKYLSSLTGSESLTEILSTTEESIFSFLPTLLREQDIVSLGDFSEEYIKNLGENPSDLPGLCSGFARWDESIGGGMRRGTVNIIGGRPKSSKSFLALNIANNVIKQNIPVLYLDTELNKYIQSCRWTALNSKVDFRELEVGQFMNDPHKKSVVQQTIQEQKKLPLSHINVAGLSPSEIISIMRRWISKAVGRYDNGATKECLIILDYLKTMDLKDMGSHQEYQYLGDTATKLHNFAVKHDIPILSMVQLNRDGIQKDTSDAISGSDRILWLCSSMTFLKNKTDEDIASGDPRSNGDKKLIVIDTRFGGGMDTSTTYINLKTNLGRSEIIEGRYNYEVQLDLDTDTLYSDDNSTTII